MSPMDVAAELRSLRREMETEYNDLWSALGVQRDNVNAGIETMNAGMQQMEEGLSQVRDSIGEQATIMAGYIRNATTRFDRIITAVESQVDLVNDLRIRVEALERKSA